MSDKIKYSIDELSNFIASGNIAKIERDTGISRHNLLRIKAKDRTIGLNIVEKLNEYYGVGEDND